MSATQEQTKKLKINVTNIKSVLTRKRKVLQNQRRIKARIIDVNIKQQKQKLRASGSGGGSGGGGTGIPQLDIIGMGLKFISGVFKFIGILLVGVLINKLPAIVNTVKGVWNTIKGAVKLTWKVIRFVGRTMSAFGKFVVNLFNFGKADENVKGISENNAELQAASSEVEEMLGPLDEEDLSLEGEEGSEESETEGGDEEATDKPAEVKPATTSTTPPSAEKANEAGTGDKLVKDKPLPKEDTKAKKDQKKQEEKPKEQWTMVDVNEKGFVYKNAAGKTKTVIPKGNAQERVWKRKLSQKNNRRQTFIIKGEEVSSEEASKYTTKAVTNMIETGALKFTDSKGVDVTPILKKTDIKSLGTEQQLEGEPTIIIMPMKETKVKKVPVGGGSVVDFGSSSTPVKTNLNLKKSVI